MNCWISCSVYVLIGLIILGLFCALVVIYYINRFRENFLRNYRQSIVEHCLSMELVSYTQEITRPQIEGIYEYKLAKGLLETSIMVSQSNCINKVPMENPPGFNHQYRVVGYHPRDNKRRMIATVFIDGIRPQYARRAIFAFTGTFFLNEWLTDLNFPLRDASGLNNYRPGVQVHTGFYNYYMTIRDQLWEIYNSFSNSLQEFYITGHSLGGALATLAAFDFAMFSPTCYTFASPRVGNPEFAKTFNNLVPTNLRIYNIEDTITQMPLPITFGYVYQHVNSGIAFNVNLGTLRLNHIDSYLRNLPICIPNIAPCPNPRSSNSDPTF